MKNIKFLLLPLTALTFIYCGRKPEPTSTPGLIAPVSSAGDRYYDVYTGDLPCDECEKTVTKLWVYKGATDTLGRYRLMQTFVGIKLDSNVVDKSGFFRAEKGYGGNSAYVLFRLDPNDVKNSRQFLKINEREMISLQGNSKPEASDPRFKLTKIGQELYTEFPAPPETSVTNK